MIIFALLNWWYGSGWSSQGRVFIRRIQRVSNTFSLAILTRTWFEPWKQTITYTDHNTSLENRFRAGVDNFVSRIIGFLVRTAVIFAALVSICLLGVLAVVILIVWPIVPLLPLLLIAVSAGVRPW